MKNKNKVLSTTSQVIWFFYLKSKTTAQRIICIFGQTKTNAKWQLKRNLWQKVKRPKAEALFMD